MVPVLRVDCEPNPCPSEFNLGDWLQHGGRRNGPGPANHQYDLKDFYAAVKAGNFPAVSYVKMPAFQELIPGNSDPLDEQQGLLSLINFLQQQPLGTTRL